MTDQKPVPELTPQEHELYEAIHRLPWTAKQAHAAFAPLAAKRKPLRRRWRHPDQEPHPWA